jgi:hypothetical protein
MTPRANDLAVGAGAVADEHVVEMLRMDPC